MKTRDFCYWLQGYFEISKNKELNEEELKIIKNHLNLVFKHDIDTQYTDGDDSQEIHDGLDYDKDNVLYRC